MLVNINGKDITEYILASSYEINSIPVYSEWEDANYIKHREIHRYRVQGSFDLKFPQDGGSAYSEFVKVLKENTVEGRLLITVFVNNTEEYKTIQAYYEAPATMARNANGRSYEKMKFKLEEC